MSRELESPVNFALVGAGSVATSLAGRFSRIPGAVGAVVGVSYRVASRIVNSLGAGNPARDASALDRSSLVVVSSPPSQMKALASSIGRAELDWREKSLVFIDCEPGPMASGPMKQASVAWMKRCPIPGRLAIGGDARALIPALRLASLYDRRPIVVADAMKSKFEAAMLLGGPGLTPVIDSVAHLLRETGMTDKQAAQTAVALFLGTVDAYGHSGRQSWDWHIQQPDVEQLQDQIRALPGPLGPLLREMLLLGFERFGRHGVSARRLRGYHESGDENALSASASPAGVVGHARGSGTGNR
jgi:pyrroline-5-carboxylate reductase